MAFAIWIAAACSFLLRLPMLMSAPPMPTRTRLPDYRHARTTTRFGSVGVLVHAPDTPDADPMQLPRLTVQAVVSILARETAEFTAAADRFAGRFPAARMTLALEDFTLYELTLGRGRYVEGFARAFNVGPQTFGELSRL
jgi:hypothetical protein